MPAGPPADAPDHNIMKYEKPEIPKVQRFPTVVQGELKVY